MIINVNASPSKNGVRIIEKSEQLKRYFNDIRSFPLMSKEEEVEKFTKLSKLKIELGNLISLLSKNGDVKTLSPLIKTKKDEINVLKGYIANSNQRFVVAVAKKFSNGTDIVDLISEGNIGLLEAIDTFDVKKGAKFSTWSVFFIRRSINRYFIETAPQVKQINRSKTFHVKSALSNKFYAKEGRFPTNEELLTMIKDEYSYPIKDASDMNEIITVSLDDGFDSSTKDGVPSWQMNIPIESNDTEKMIDKDYDVEVVRSLMSVLDEREKVVVTLFFGIGAKIECDMGEIANRLGLTTERVRQIRNEALNKMKHQLPVYYGKQPVLETVKSKNRK